MAEKFSVYDEAIGVTKGDKGSKVLLVTDGQGCPSEG
jgi:hypothetical protein